LQKTSDKELNRLHEVEGAKIAANILRRISFSTEENCREICSIIENHDSGDNPTNLEEKLVKDADKLFRFNPRGFDIDNRRFKMQPQKYWEYLRDNKKQWLYTDYAKVMATEGLEDIRQQFL